MVRRFERLLVEPHGAVDHALRRRSIHLQRHQVRRDQRECSGAPEVLDDVDMVCLECETPQEKQAIAELKEAGIKFDRAPR